MEYIHVLFTKLCIECVLCAMMIEVDDTVVILWA